MQPTSANQIVKFHSPMADENPNQKYVVIEIDYPRALIMALDLGMIINPTYRVNVDELIIAN